MVWYGVMYHTSILDTNEGLYYELVLLFLALPSRLFTLPRSKAPSLTLFRKLCRKRVCRVVSWKPLGPALLALEVRKGKGC